MRNILTSSLELNNFKIATIEASVGGTEHASVTMPTIARGYRKGDTVTLLSDGNILIKTAGGDILGYITISLDTGASILYVQFNAASMVINTQYPLTEDINYIDYGISYTPPTKRLSLSVETDGVTSSDGEWIDDNGQDISYVDMPDDYKAIFLTGNSSDRYDFIPVDSNWDPASSEERFIADPRGIQGIVFKGIKYVPYGGTAFDVDLTTTYQAIPTGETGEFLKDGDKMIMVFESGGSGGCASTYTKTSIQNGATILSAVQTYLNTEFSANSTSITMPGSLNYVALGDDNNYYFFVNVDWTDSSWSMNQWCIAIKCSSTGTDIEYGRAQDQESSGGRRQVDAIFNNGTEWSLSSMGYSSWQDMGEGICSYINA